MKACPKCDTRYSICKRHPALGYQPWMLEERLGRSCKAKMWTFSCRKCVKKGAHLSIVLCPGCKAPFANKGPKWYLGLHEKCKWAKTRKNCYKRLQKEVECLLNLGEPPLSIIDELQSFLGLHDHNPQTSSPEPTANRASPNLGVSDMPPKPALNEASPEPAVNHASPFSVNNAAKSGTPINCAKTTLTTKAVKLECESAPKNSSKNTKESASFLEIFDDVQNTANGSPEHVEDYDFAELSEFYFQEKHIDGDPDCKIERKRRRNEGHLQNSFSLLSGQPMSMIF